MRFISEYSQQQYDRYTVEEEAPLMDWLLAHLGESRSKVKATLQGRGI